WVSALGIEWREFLLDSVDLRAFEPPLIVIEWDIVVCFGPREDALDRGGRDLEKCSGGVLLTTLSPLSAECLGPDVLGGDLLEEALLDSVAEWWPTDTLAVGDGGVDALLDARADHLPLGIGEHHHHVEHHLYHPVVLADRPDGL